MRSEKNQYYGRVRLDRGHHIRIVAVMLVLGILAFLPVILRLYQLMIAEYDYYADLALQNQTRVTSVSADRGDIYDRNMNVLASSRTVENIYLNPRELKQAGENLEEIADFLGEILEKDPEWILLQAGNLSRRYMQVGARVEKEQADQIRSFINEREISGIHLEPTSVRVYPFGSLAAQVIGFANTSGTGSEGLEASYDAFLTGGTGQVITTKGNNEMDMPFSYERYLASRPGNDVILTLDAVVQMSLEKQLQAAMARYDVQNGAFGLVMNCKTGEILAMATLGGYDPNRYLEIADPAAADELNRIKMEYESFPEHSAPYREGKALYAELRHQAQLKQWRNRVLSDGYEPGSTFKVLTMAAALDCGAIDLNTDFYCRGAEQIPGRSQLLHCWRHQGHGAEKTPQALQNSCNIAFAHIALKLGGARFYEYVKRFGVLEKTGIDLNGESKGVFFDRELVVNTDRWGTASLTSGSFGQTFKVTPLQLVRAISSVVNGGELMEPYLVAQVVDVRGNILLEQEPTAVRRTVSPETSETMCRLLRSVVTEGTAKNAQVAGFSIGGKTGTSEKIDVFDEKGQRVQDKIVSFVGIAPMDDPEYIVLAALDTPSRSSGIYISGGVMAAPTVGAILEEILPYLSVERIYEEGEIRETVMEDFLGLTKEETDRRLTQLGLTARYLGNEETVTGQIPGKGQCLPGGSQVLIYLGDRPEQRTAKVPDFTGMDIQQANDAAGLLGLYTISKGNTTRSPEVVATGQYPAAGTEVPVGSAVTVEFADTKAQD